MVESFARFGFRLSWNCAQPIGTAVPCICCCDKLCLLSEMFCPFQPESSQTTLHSSARPQRAERCGGVVVALESGGVAMCVLWRCRMCWLLMGM
jgi:hypothetical protein